MHNTRNLVFLIFITKPMQDKCLYTVMQWCFGCSFFPLLRIWRNDSNKITFFRKPVLLLDNWVFCCALSTRWLYHQMAYGYIGVLTRYRPARLSLWTQRNFDRLTQNYCEIQAQESFPKVLKWKKVMKPGIKHVKPIEHSRLQRSCPVSLAWL